MDTIKPEPLLIEVPGIPGKLRSQTLDEYMSALVPEHPARQELSQIRSLALEGMKNTHDLVVALQRVNELEKQLTDLKIQLDVKKIESAPPVPPVTKVEAPTFLCPECGKVCATDFGLRNHIRLKHPHD